MANPKTGLNPRCCQLTAALLDGCRHDVHQAAAVIEAIQLAGEGLLSPQAKEAREDCR